MCKACLPYFVGIFFLLGGPVTAMAEELPSEQTSPAGEESEPSSPSDQDVQSRGFLPKFPSPPPAPKIRSLSTSEKNLAKLIFQNTINYDLVKVTDTLGAGG